MNHNGFSLIEVLVALVVLSIGLLGIAALHIDSVRNGQAALQRTRAVNLAADMADRLRSNPNGDYNVGAGPAGAEPDPLCADNADNEAPRDCSAAEMVTFDVWEWRSSLAGESATGLPGGQGRIDLDTSTDPDSLIVTVNWSDRGQPSSFSLAVQR